MSLRKNPETFEYITHMVEIAALTLEISAYLPWYFVLIPDVEQAYLCCLIKIFASLCVLA